MRRSAQPGGKGWFTGPWEGPIPTALGYSDVAVDELHTHDEMFEVYLVARGESIAVVAGQRIMLAAGDLLVVEPGEAHTFVSSSDDYLHFVVQTPFIGGDKRSS
jgi:mannose-6-phosphate isomerase-like protein (cupin superfamily)